MRPNVQRLEILAFGDKGRARFLLAERSLHGIIHVVVDVEQIAPRAGRDVAVGAVHGVAVEEHHAAGGAGGAVDAEAAGQLAQAVLVGDADLLLAQGLLVVIFRCGSISGPLCGSLSVKRIEQDRQRMRGMPSSMCQVSKSECQ